MTPERLEEIRSHHESDKCAMCMGYLDIPELLDYIQDLNVNLQREMKRTRKWEMWNWASMIAMGESFIDLGLMLRKEGVPVSTLFDMETSGREEKICGKWQRFLVTRMRRLNKVVSVTKAIID